MANTAANVLVGFPLTTGGVLAGPLGTTLPTDATTAPDPGFIAAGYISEDGVTQTIDSDTEDIVAWGGDIVRVINTTHALSYQFSFLETNEAVLSEVYGEANVTGSGADLSVAINSTPLPHRSYLLEVLDGDRRVRIVIPDGQITERGEVVYVHTDAVKYEVTVTAYPDATGNKAYIYTAAVGAVAITGVTAGTPGEFTPAGASAPADLAALKADPVVGDSGTAEPGSAWTTGQYVVLGDNSHAYHDGTAWAAGEAP